MTTRHILKTWPEYFREVRAGRKAFEIRWDDRDFKVGDVLDLAEFDPVKGCFTGETEVRRVTFAMRDEEKFGLMPGYVALGMEPLDTKAQIPNPSDLGAAGLLAWHEEQARNAHVRAGNWRASAADYARQPNAEGPVAKFTACATLADLEAGFHAKAAILVRALVRPQGVADA